ncbi:MAG: hypothetical protein JXJ19_05515 [Elusimicrobia bacterium]|nr:hypothetical protein [Elusimicrobiota bacterium]
MRLSKIAAIAAFPLLLASAGCLTTYNQKLAPVKSSVKSGKYDKALAGLDKSGMTSEDKDRLLYHLEAGLLYHLAGDYEKSNYFLERAEWISDELYTKSLTAEGASLMTSDNVLPYRGEYFDYLYTNYYKLLNYLHLGSLEDALVEVRRINHKLSMFEQDDAFMHYLTAILYQHNGQDADAFIEYKKAYNAYQAKRASFEFPGHLKKDMAVFCRESRFPRCSEFSEDIRRYDPDVPADYGSVVFIVETGFVPYKYENVMEAAIPMELRKKHPNELREAYYLRVALPEYLSPEDWVKKVTINLNFRGNDSDLAEDLSGMVLKNFESERSKESFKAISRAVTKYIAYKSVRGKNNSSDDNTLRKILGASVNILGAATEKADTRSWLTLPDRIFISHLYLPPGKYNFTVTLDPAKEKSRTTDQDTFTIKKGEIKFIVLREFI